MNEVLHHMAINWGDTFFRVFIATMVWLFYREFLKYKRELEEVKLENQKNKQKIQALRVLTNSAHNILMELLMEGRDRSNQSINAIAQQLSNLSGKEVFVSKEHPDVTKYKDKLNDKLDAEHERLDKLLDS